MNQVSARDLCKIKTLKLTMAVIKNINNIKEKSIYGNSRNNTDNIDVNNSSSDASN